MAVKIITGNIGSGKTEYCLREIKEKHSLNPNRRCVMLVPSHYSHETEKMIIDKFGGTGLNNIEVTSFEKLARELLSGIEKRLAAPGKQVLICRAVEMCLDELEEKRSEFDSRLILAVSKSGFLDVAQSLISEFRRYVVTSSEIRRKTENEPDGILKQKMKIAAMISDNYDKLLGETEYVDSDEDLMRLSAVIGGSFGTDTSIWIDKFDEFLPQQMQVVTALIDSGADITVAFNTCDDAGDTYYGTLAAIEKIRDYCGAEIVRLPGSMQHLENAPDLKFLFSTWFDRSVYQPPVHNAEVFEGRDAYTEIEHIACRILDFVREDKYRFRDISVICGNTDSYTHIIEAVFDEYDIPYYSDIHLSIADHPIAMQILSLFDVIENNWDYASVFEYLRAGFVYLKQTGTDNKTKYRRIPSDDIDKLENYVLKYGIRGKSTWCRTWDEDRKNIVDTAFGREESGIKKDNSEIEGIRKSVTEPIEKYCQRVKTAVTVTDYCCALYEFLEDINLYPGLKAELLGMAVNRATADAQRFGQIWNLILDILDQINTALGSSKVTQEQFFSYMRAAMTKCTLRTIPSGVDRVFIGSVEKNKAVNSPIIFMAGAVMGTFPSETAIEGFLSNADREKLNQMDIKLAPVTEKKNLKQYNYVYKSLSAVTDKLCISYPLQTTDGKGCRPSRTVLDICGKLPQIRIYDDISVKAGEEKQMYVSSPKATMHKLLIHPKNHPLWTHVNAWFEENEQWRGMLYETDKVCRDFSDRIIKLDEKLASKLYRGQIMYSATRLNAYAQCPFGYFLQYGLRARERDKWEISAADVGSYAHELIRRFCEAVDNSEDFDWNSIDDNTIGEIIDEIVKKTIEQTDSDGIREKERTQSIFIRMGKTVKEAAKTVKKSIVSGEFEPFAYEKEVKVAFSDNVGIQGKIDRLDICRRDGINEYRIIDYKTGKQDFSVSEVYNRYDMQPVIYAAVMRMLDDKSMISGMYYSKVRNDYATLKSGGRIATAASHLKANTELSGVTFADTDENGDITPESADRIESEFAREEDPLIFKKGVQTGGNIRSREAGERLIEKVCGNVMDMDREIRNGSIDISPLDHKTSQVSQKDAASSCKYCDYKEVCKFDEAICRVRKIKESDNEVWQLLENDEV